MAKHLVTGGAGFIGSHLVDRLLARGDDVCVLDNFSSGRRENLAHVRGEVELIEGDIRDPACLQRATRGAAVVFHQAALGSVPRSVEDPATTHEVNATGTLNVLLAARETGARVVFASSSSIYGPTQELPKRVELPPNPASPYALSKYAGERFCQLFYELYGLPTVCLRYFNVFGPRQDPDSPYAAVIPLFVRALLAGEAPTIFGDGEQSRDFTYVEDAVEANLLAAAAPESAFGGVCNVGGGRRLTLNALFAALSQIVGAQVAPTHAPPRAGDVRHSLAEIGHSRALIGYAPGVALEEGLQRTVAWVRGR